METDLNIPFELNTLLHANHYSKWIYQSVAKHLGSRILELGAGIGNITQWLPRRELLVVTEAEPALMNFTKNRIGTTNPAVVFQLIDLDLSFSEQVKRHDVDTIVSFNVLEHIQDDIAAAREQVKVLKQSNAKGTKRLVIFVPAHPFAFGSFDEIFKHYRRYSAKGLRQLFASIDPALKVKTYYFNLLTLPGWLFAGRVVKSTRFSPVQMKIVNAIIPFWAPFDWLIHHLFCIPLGQSVIAVVEVK